MGESSVQRGPTKEFKIKKEEVKVKKESKKKKKSKKSKKSSKKKKEDDEWEEAPQVSYNQMYTRREPKLEADDDTKPDVKNNNSSYVNGKSSSKYDKHPEEKSSRDRDSKK